MTTYHLVEQGEHLSGIAKKYGFLDHRSIWDDPENAELKEQRQNPHVLYPLDCLFIPDRELQEYSRQTEKRHHFRLRGQPLMLRIRLERTYGKPIANTKCVLQVEFERCELNSDGKGQINLVISKTSVRATLIIKDTALIKRKEVSFDIEIPMMVGFLDPIDKPSGQLARLINLGYYRGESDEVDQLELRSAIEEFQCEHNLTVDGICGPHTRAKLEEVHGC